MQSRTALIFRTRVIEISNRGKQPLRHQLKTKLDNLNSNNNKVDSKHRTRMLILLNSSRTEMHKGGRTGHSNKDVHTISTVSMPRLRAM